MISDFAVAETLYSVSRQLNSSLDLDEVLGNVLRLTVEATTAMRGSLFLFDRNGEVIRRILARPNQSAQVVQDVVRQVMTEGLAGWVYRHREPALLADTAQDDRWVRFPNDSAIIGAAIVVPLIYRGHVNGLVMLHHEQVDFFTEDHLALTVRIAEQAAVAVENARLFTQVKDEREALFVLMRGMPIPVLVVLDGQITFRNQAAKRELLVQESDTLLSDMNGGNELRAALNELRENNVDHVEVRWPDNRVFNVSLNEEAKHGAVVALDDITYLKELDAMKTAFVETVSHDLKNPLSVIQGFATLLQYSKDLSDVDQGNVKSILQGAKQMQVLIENLLDLAQIEAGVNTRITLCNLVEIVCEVLDSFKFKLEEKEMILTTNLPEDIANIQGDALRLSQIVSNYVSNAIKYTPPGGRINVVVSHKAPEVWFSVTDNGPGIKPANQAQLFQKFYRVPQEGDALWIEGTGLGLSIVKAIAESYSGRVWVESEVGIGSTFGCVLPVFANSDKR